MRQVLVDCKRLGFAANFGKKRISSAFRETAEVKPKFRELFGEVLEERCGTNNGDFVYLDDAIFIDDHVISDFAKITGRISRQV